MSVSPCPSMEERLERDEVVFFAESPFALPHGDDHLFLLHEVTGRRGCKNISYNPHTGAATGFAHGGGDHARRLAGILGDFARQVRGWVERALPRYAGGIEPDRVSYRPEEEATRHVRLNARNDLLHIDAFPSRPSRGRRILRVFANVNPGEPRVWATSEPLPQLLARYGEEAARYGAGWLGDVREELLGLFRPSGRRATVTDRRMRRLHDYLKANHDFQQRGPRRLWRFPPGSAWLAMTDCCSYAELRGRYALEHSFFVAPRVLVCPELAPEALLGTAS